MTLEELLQQAGVGKGVEKKANENMHTGNTGYGAEFVPSEVFASEIFDIVPQRGRLLPLLPGSHGTNLPKTYTAPVVGLSIGDTVFQGKGEWTTGTPAETQDDHGISKVATMNVTLTQVPFICEVRISDEQLKYNAVNTEQYVKDRIAAGMAYTVESVIINGDIETGSTGNVNSDDQAPATTFAATGGAKDHRLMIDHGIRERAISGSYTVDAGTLGEDDYSALLGVLGEYSESPEDVLFIQNVSVNKPMRAIAAFADASKNGDRSLIAKGILPTPYGTDVLVHRAVPKTEADGKMSATSSNNTKGQVLAIYKPAIQYGFGQDFKLEVVRVPGYGYRLVATFDFAFSIVDSGASLTSPTVAAAINITL